MMKRITICFFMSNETVIFKDGKGINREATYLGTNLSDGILKHKIQTRKNTEFLVDGILFFSLDAPEQPFHTLQNNTQWIFQN